VKIGRAEQNHASLISIMNKKSPEGLHKFDIIVVNGG